MEPDRRVTPQILPEPIKSQVSGDACLAEELSGDWSATMGVPKSRRLQFLADHYHIPAVEYEEALQAPAAIIHKLNMEALKSSLWFPLVVTSGMAQVIAVHPGQPALVEEIRNTLKVERIEWLVALRPDLIRIIENNQDVNPGFPASAGRTHLARLRTFLAEHRTLLSSDRTILAKGRTGLAFMRTGVSFITIALVLFKIFGLGYSLIPELLLLLIGLAATIDGFVWYLPTRRTTDRHEPYQATESTFGTSVLYQQVEGENSTLHRTAPIAGAAELRSGWNRLSPVMKRRFLAIDRTDLAEERTTLAYFRKIMAEARTGLAFARTGIAFIGLGIALLRQFPASWLDYFSEILILIGTLMTLEGFHWYVPGHRAGRKGMKAVENVQKGQSIWNFMFPPFHQRLSVDDLHATLSLKASEAPGIYGTSGLALERTLIAERRNVKSRLRTVMARARTGMSFIRTGTRFFSVGLGLLVYFGLSHLHWVYFNAVLILAGLFLMADGLYWLLPAEKIKNQFPYCFAEMEIVFPDYGQPSRFWKRVIFSHDDL